MSAFPHPMKIDEIKTLFDAEREKHPDYYKYWERYTVENKVHFTLYNYAPIVDSDIKIKTGKYPITDSPLFNSYSLMRAMNQSNEACNKVLATVELLYALSVEPQILAEHIIESDPNLIDYVYMPLCPSFNIKYAGGTIIPTLYYAHLSSIISLLSSFGCVSIRCKYSNKFYNLVRRKEFWYVYSRNDYINKISGTRHDRMGWHDQIFEIMKQFTQNLEYFPNIDYEKTKELQGGRDKTHYEILSSVSASNIVSLNTYFNFLPLVINTMNKSLYVISKIYYPAGLAGCDRFRELHSKIKSLYTLYQIEMPDELLPIQF